MSLETIIIIGILILAGIAFWSTQLEKKTFLYQTDIKLSPADFERDFGKIKINGGTLCFWGKWFGRPMDNYHEITKVKYNRELKLLQLILSDGEKLLIWNPSDIELAQRELGIQRADKILFEWHLYGESKTDDNLRFLSFKNKLIYIDHSTDYMPSNVQNTQCNILKPALSIIGY